MKSRMIIDIRPFDRKNDCWNVVVETPRGSQHKYKYEPKENAFYLHTMLPEGMSFPYDFGFLPQTKGDDGDPLDVLVILRDGTFSGCIVPCRLVGVIEATQKEKGQPTQRNDRLIAIPLTCRDETEVRSAKELNPHVLEEIEGFFESYNRAFGKKFKVLRVRGPQVAMKLARAGMRRNGKVSR